MCPLLLLVPGFIRIDNENSAKTDNNTAGASNKNEQENKQKSSTNNIGQTMRKFKHFYTAPTVKFCCHSVTTAILH